jgi:hypothetical protein
MDQGRPVVEEWTRADSSATMHINSGPIHGCCIAFKAQSNVYHTKPLWQSIQERLATQFAGVV